MKFHPEVKKKPEIKKEVKKVKDENIVPSSSDSFPAGKKPRAA
jgi:hypothetical protein